MRTLGVTELSVFPLCLGTNVMGWTADRHQSFELLDTYAKAGGTFLDTADVYSAWVDGNDGGESERIIGDWMASRRNRDRMIVATKVGTHPHRAGLTAENIRRALSESLQRLRTDYVDLYYAHVDDANTPLEQTLMAFDALVSEGHVRYVGASNYRAERLEEALEICDRASLTRYSVIQPRYNLIERVEYERGLQQLCQREKLAVLPYYALARGFLTGKYRRGTAIDTRRGRHSGADLLADGGARAALDLLVEIAREQDTAPSAVALSWLLSRPGVSAPIASARTPEQLRELLLVGELNLSAGQLSRLDSAMADRLDAAKG